MKLENVYLIMEESRNESWPIEAYQYERVAEARLKELLETPGRNGYFIQEIALDKKST